VNFTDPTGEVPVLVPYAAAGLLYAAKLALKALKHEIRERKKGCKKIKCPIERKKCEEELKKLQEKFKQKIAEKQRLEDVDRQKHHQGKGNDASPNPGNY